jgi:hypothetical protein
MVTCSKCGQEGHSFMHCPHAPERAAKLLAQRNIIIEPEVKPENLQRLRQAVLGSLSDPVPEGRPARRRKPDKEPNDPYSHRPETAASRSQSKSSQGNRNHDTPDTAPLSPLPSRRKPHTGSSESAQDQGNASSATAARDTPDIAPSVITPAVITRDRLKLMSDEDFAECYNAVMAEKMRRWRAKKALR